MKQTAGLQVNLDFSDELDCLAKLRLGQALAPLLYAIFANSPVMEGHPIGHQSVRGHIWSHTDDDRTGLIADLFKPDANFQTYVDYALDVPMYFIVRDNNYIDLTRERFTFRRYLADGYAGRHALMSDWDLHLSTLFPEVRLRPQIEFRSIDALPPGLTLSVAAFLKGIFYDRQAMEQAWGLFSGHSVAELLDLYRQSWTLGLKSRLGSRSLTDLAQAVLQISRDGLVRQRVHNDQGLDESIYLDDLIALIKQGTTLADLLLQRWTGNRAQDLEILKRHCGFF